MEEMAVNPFIIFEDVEIGYEIFDNEIYYSLNDVGKYIGIGNPSESKRYLDEKGIKRSSSKGRIFINVKNIFRLLFYAKNTKLNLFVSWLINVLLPFAYDNKIILLKKEAEVTIADETEEIDEDDILDEESYILLNKELKKQNFIFNKEILKIEQLFMELGDVIDRANEAIASAGDRIDDKK